MILFDTTFLIDLLHNNSEAVEKYNDVVKNQETFSTSEINVFELLVGIKVKKSEKHALSAINIVKQMRILDLNRNAAIHAADICAELIVDGKQIGDSDCLIAGICLANNCHKIITKNIKHFERIKGLRVETY